MHVGLRQKFGQKHHLTFVGSIRSTDTGVPVLKNLSIYPISAAKLLHFTGHHSAKFILPAGGHLDCIRLECFLEMQRPKILAASSAIVFAFQKPPVPICGILSNRAGDDDAPWQLCPARATLNNDNNFRQLIAARGQESILRLSLSSEAPHLTMIEARDESLSRLLPDFTSPLKPVGV